MRVLFESYPYELTDTLKKSVGSSFAEDDSTYDKTLYSINGKTIVFNCVGYYYNLTLQDCVFILPKVFLHTFSSDVIRAFITDDKNPNSGFKPDEIVYFTKEQLEHEENRQFHEMVPFISRISLWVYQSIQRYCTNFGVGNLYEDGNLQRVVTTPGESTETWLDTVVTMFDFYKKHRTLITFIAIDTHSGVKKVNWRKTISRKTALLQNGVPIYINVINKDKTINFEEDLIVLFLSSLRYLNQQFMFDKIDSTGYELLNEREMERMIETGQGERIMRNIRHKYFSDELVQLWQIMYLFFKQTYGARNKKQKSERTVVKKYDRVFENMIDQLIGDDLPKALSYMKSQDDGKTIDHIYREESLIYGNSKDIFYIGDSKYYKDSTAIGKNSVAKQYTYAKNVIQYCMNIFNNKADSCNKDEKISREEELLYDRLYYRDDLTEGYNITPNFFIEGVVKPDHNKKENWRRAFDYTEPEFVDDKISKGRNYQFKNRLFDRDTLILQAYNMNFLYVLASYVKHRENKLDLKRIRNVFKEKLIESIDEQYAFYLLEPRNVKYEDTIEELVSKYFKIIIGKVFRPYQDRNLLLLALENVESVKKENDSLLLTLSNDFEIYDYSLKYASEPLCRENLVKHNFNDCSIYEINIAAENTITMSLDGFEKEIILVGCYKNDEHLRWIEQNDKYNVRIGDRLGSVNENDAIVSKAKYLFLYDIETQSNFKLYTILSCAKTSKEAMLLQLNYPDPQGDYMVYDIQIASYSQNKKRLIEERFKDIFSKSNPVGAPVYISKEEIDRL